MLCALLRQIIHRVTTNTFICALKGEKSMRDLHGAQGILLQESHFHVSSKKGLPLGAISYLTENLLFCPLHVARQPGGWCGCLMARCIRTDLLDTAMAHSVRSEILFSFGHNLE